MIAIPNKAPTAKMLNSNMVSRGSSVSLAVKRFHPNAKLWLNDKDTDVVNVLLALRDRPGEFISQCEALEAKNMREKRDIYEDAWIDEQMDRALRYYIVRRWSFCAQIDIDVPKTESFSPVNADKGLRTDHLKSIHF